MNEDGPIEIGAVLARWEAVRERWALDVGEEAGLLGGSGIRGSIADVASWRAPRMEERMRLLIDLGGALDAVLTDGHRICLWLRQPRPSFGMTSPIEVMSSSVAWISKLRAAALDFVTW